MTTLLTIKQVAVWLNMRPSTLYAWASQGKIPYRKIHRLIRFEQDAIKQWLASFHPSQPISAAASWGRHMTTDVDMLIAAAKRDVYTAAHGETRLTASPQKKEGANGAR
jgi:excisionase family DNA binding protein